MIGIEGAMQMARLTAERKAKEEGREPTYEDYAREFNETWARWIDAQTNADMARISLHQSRQHPVWLRPIIWGICAFVIVFVIVHLVLS